MISSADYQAWLDSDNKRPIYLAEIGCADGTIYRPATNSYFDNERIWRGRVPEFTFDWGIKGDIGGQSKFQVGEIQIVNLDAEVDEWRTQNMTSVTIYHGDETWDFDSFYQIYTGIPASPRGSREALRVALRDKQYEAFTDLDFVALTNGLPGAMALELLTSPQGPFDAADIDTAAFTQLDADFPYPCQLSTSGDGLNIFKMVDQILGGFPVDWGTNNHGQLTLFRLRNASGATNYRVVKPTDWREINRLDPIGEVTLKGEWPGDDVVQKDQAILDAYPNARKVTYTTKISAEADGNLLAGHLLALGAQPRDLVPIETNRSDPWQPGDEINIDIGRYGYDGGQYGIIQNIKRRELRQDLIVRV